MSDTLETALYNRGMNETQSYRDIVVWQKRIGLAKRASLSFAKFGWWYAFVVIPSAE